MEIGTRFGGLSVSECFEISQRWQIAFATGVHLKSLSSRSRFIKFFYECKSGIYFQLVDKLVQMFRKRGYLEQSVRIILRKSLSELISWFVNVQENPAMRDLLARTFNQSWPIRMVTGPKSVQLLVFRAKHVELTVNPCSF